MGHLRWYNRLQLLQSECNFDPSIHLAFDELHFLPILGHEFFSKPNKTLPPQNWGAPEPNRANGGECCKCVRMMPPRTWDDVMCSNLDFYPVLCRKPIGYFRGSNGVYYKIIHKQVTSYDDALAACQAEGASLAVPYGLANVRGLDAIRAIPFATGLDGYWLDGTDQAQEGIWMMKDGKYYFLMAIQK